MRGQNAGDTQEMRRLQRGKPHGVVKGLPGKGQGAATSEGRTAFASQALPGCNRSAILHGINTSRKHALFRRFTSGKHAPSGRFSSEWGCAGRIKEEKTESDRPSNWGGKQSKNARQRRGRKQHSQFHYHQPVATRD
jgi:hypothetical protein